MICNIVLIEVFVSHWKIAFAVRSKYLYVLYTMQYIHSTYTASTYILVAKTQKAQDILSVHSLNRQQAKAHKRDT